jgi:hypothetical protein
MPDPEFNLDDMLRLGAENSRLKARIAELEKQPLRLGDMDNMEGYELAYGSEGVGSRGVSGVKIFVRRYPETIARIKALSNVRPDGRLSDREKENGIFYDVGHRVEQVVAAQSIRLDPKTWEREATTKAEFEKAFTDAGLGPIFMEPIPNEYHRADDPYAMGEPWYNVATPIGYIKIGWRKRVINIDWTRTTLKSLVEEKYGDGKPRPPGGEELFPTIVKEGETTTLGDFYVHAYGYEKATKYLKVMFEHSKKGVRKLEPKQEQMQSP